VFLSACAGRLPQHAGAACQQQQHHHNIIGSLPQECCQVTGIDAIMLSSTIACIALQNTVYTWLHVLPSGDVGELNAQEMLLLLQSLLHHLLQQPAAAADL
jgi:hypothetical protein